MRRPLLVLPVLALAIAAVAAQAWAAAGRAARDELVERGRGVADVVAAAVAESRGRARALEEREHQRLEAAARRLRAELALPAGPAQARLPALAEEERLGRVHLLGAGGARLARYAREPLGALPTGEAPGPALGGEAEWQRAAALAAPLLAGERETLREGARPNVFGTLHRVAVGVRTEGGALLVEADAEDVAALARGADLGGVLRGLCALPDVRRVRLGQGEEAVAEAGEPARPGDLAFERTLASGGGPELSLVLHLSPERSDALAAAARRQVLLWALLALAAAAFATLGLARRAARREREGRQARAEQREQRHLAEMGVLTGLLVHELASPLNALALQVAGLERALGPPALEHVGRLKATLARARAALESFLHLAPAAPGAAGAYGPAELALTARELEQEQSAARVALAVEPAAAGLQAAGRPAALDQALRNVLRNAFQASPAGGVVEVAWLALGADRVGVRVRDQGPGFPAELLRDGPALGRGRRPGGHGLGLFLARRVATGAGGSLALGAAPGGGAEVLLELPAGPGARR